MDETISVEIGTILAIHNYTLHLDGISVKVQKPVGLIKCWSFVDPACLFLNRQNETFVVNVNLVVFVSQEQIILQGRNEPVQFTLNPGEWVQVTTQQLKLEEMMRYNTYYKEIEKRAEKYLEKIENEKSTQSPSENLETYQARNKLIQAYAKDFPV